MFVFSFQGFFKKKIKVRVSYVIYDSVRLVCIDVLYIWYCNMMLLYVMFMQVDLNI